MDAGDASGIISGHDQLQALDPVHDGDVGFACALFALRTPIGLILGLSVPFIFRISFRYLSREIDVLCFTSFPLNNLRINLV